VVSATIAVNERFSSGEIATFIHLTFWEKLGEIAVKYLKKGSPIYVEGSLRITTSGEGDQKKYWTSVNVRELIMLGGKPVANEDGDHEPAKEEGDLPF
jgi:single-strand DNA-binding protein